MASRHPDIPTPERDCKFAISLGRKFAADFCFHQAMILVELDGGGNRSRHASVKGAAADCTKQNLAAKLGFRVMRYNVIALKNMIAVVDEVAEIVRDST